MHVVVLLQVCDMALHFLDVCLPPQGRSTRDHTAPPTPVPATSSCTSRTAAQPQPQPPQSCGLATASASGHPLPAVASSCPTIFAIEPLAALADPEAQAAFMQERLILAGHAVEIAALALSRWAPPWDRMMAASQPGPAACPPPPI